MKTVDVFGYSFNAIKLRKLRAALTTLGVIIGIAAIVALLSITQGLQTTLTGQLNQGLSADTLIVTAGSGGGFGSGSGGGFGGGAPSGGLGGSSSSGSGFTLYANYTSEISSLSPDIESVIAIMSRSGYIVSDNLNTSVTIYGVDFNQYSNVYSTFQAENGSIPTNPSDNDVVVGTRVNQPGNNGTIYFTTGSTVNVTWMNATVLPPVNETYSATVAGVLKEVGGLGMGGPSDTGVYIPLSKYESFFNSSEASQIIVKLKNSDNATITNVSKAITDHFSNQVSVVSSTAVLSTMTSIFSILELFLAGIAGISLLVAGVGIMNIMVVSLIERTREIGILKALGMKSRTVLSIFLGESVIIGLIGAVVGIIAGYGLAVVVAQVLGSGLLGTAGAFALTPVLTPLLLIGSLAFGVGVSVIFALYPAWRASKLKPVDALRYE